MEESLIANLPNRLQKDIEAYGQPYYFHKNETIFTPEVFLKYFFIVFKGRIKVSQLDAESGKEQILKILTTGDMYDIVSLLDGEIHNNLLTSLDDHTQVMRFPIHIVRSWFNENNSFRQLILPYIAKQIRETEELALDLSLHNTSQRLFRLIVKNIDPETPGKLKLIHDLPHEEIAALIGTTRKVLNRQLQELKSEGIIDIKRKNITPKNTDKLTGWSDQ
ncbi:MAG: Crp/Fnr family transcriptional regulator [Sulfurovum sp.]